MMKLARLAAIVAAGLLACAPAAGQRLNAFPAAGAVSPTDTVIGQQPSLCQAASCNGVQISLAQLRAFTLLGNAASASKLAAATTINGVAFDGSAAAYTLPAVDTATPRVPTSLTISTAAPLAGGGALTGNLTLSIGAASGAAAGTMSAADKSKLDGIAAGATANMGTVTSVSATGANGIGVTVTNAGTTPSIAITGSALTPSTLAATGAVTGSNLSGTNTGDQTITLTGDATGTGTGSLAVALASSGVTSGTYGASGSLTVPIITFDAKGRGTAASSYALGSAATYAIGTSGGTIGLLNGSNTYSGAMTFSQVITGAVSGNAGTATALQTARTINGVSFNGTANITVAAVDTATPRLATASNLSDLASASTARSNLGVSATGTDPNYCLLTGCTLTGTISATTASFSAGLNVGTTTASQTATPVSVSLGGTYSNAAGANLKVKLLDIGSTTTGYGLGVSSNQLDYVVKDGAGASHAFWVNGTLGARIGTGGVTTGTVRFTTTSTVSNLGTCNASTQGTRTIVTDAASPSFLATLSGGGSVVAPAFCNGSAWVAG